MPSHRDRRDRSASPRRDKDRDHRAHAEPDRDREKKHRRRRERTPSDDGDLLDLRQLGVKEIAEEDYFIKSAEFKLWLKEEREKYLDEMSSEAAHKAFRKFIRRWNDGALKERYYHPQPSTALPSSSNTAYKWSFATNRSRVDTAALAAARADVDRLTHAKSSSTNAVGPSLPSSSRPVGPALPSAADRQYALEATQDERRAEGKTKARERYERADEAVPKSGGKEGRMEEKKATNAENREFREKDMAAGLDAEEGTLMGENGGFAAALRARDAASARRTEKKAAAMADRRAADEERLSERKQKETATMDMFKALAKQRFG